MSSGGVATELIVNQKTFSALDEIIGSYCAPFASFLNDIFGHEVTHYYRSYCSLQKFNEGMTADDLAVKLSSNAQREFQAIHWGIVIDSQTSPKDPAERFILVAVTHSVRSGAPKVIRDSIYVSNNGYRLWLRNDKSVWTLLNWWKTEGFRNVGKFPHQIFAQRQQYHSEYQRHKLQ